MSHPPGTPSSPRLRGVGEGDAGAVAPEGGPGHPHPFQHLTPRGWLPVPASEALLPQEILEEVVRELHKVKEEIIDGESGSPWS